MSPSQGDVTAAKSERARECYDMWQWVMGWSRLWPAQCDHYQTNVLSSHHKYICEVVQFLHNVCHKNIDKRGTPLWAWGVALCLTIAEKWQAARSPHTSDSETWWAPDPGADMSPALVTGWLVIEWQKRDLFSDFKIIQICLMLESRWVMFDAKFSKPWLFYIWGEFSDPV